MEDIAHIIETCKEKKSFIRLSKERLLSLYGEKGKRPIIQNESKFVDKEFRLLATMKGLIFTDLNWNVIEIHPFPLKLKENERKT